ncbi:MAG: hypothetical protein MUP63_01295 [Candidatus Nanohaloarchaeota archaeon QJJ-7]|nr:hypothetical protein [Candidatus Nanohaloarchaeota archaeon QJJ-7]
MNTVVGATVLMAVLVVVLTLSTGTSQAVPDISDISDFKSSSVNDMESTQDTDQENTDENTDEETENGDSQGSIQEYETIGGGSPYIQKVESEGGQTFCSSSSGDIVVQEGSLTGLKDALSMAGQDDVVYIPGDMTIDMEFNTQLQVPEGVTVASNRGCNGAEGALITTDMKQEDDWVGADEIILSDNTRITGLRLEGPYGESDFFEFKDDYTNGIEAGGASNVEIDNVEVYGYPNGIHGGDLHVHHSHIHHNSEEGLGYGISSPKTGSLIEYNYMDYNRHHVAGSGDSDVGYIFRYNVIGSHGMIHSLDMHPPGGDTIRIHHNTIKFQGNANVRIRGIPENIAEIHHNWFYNDISPCTGEGHCAINQREVSEFTNLDFYENHYGTSEPACGIGAPREGCPPP